jgi:hypothetical protein
MKRFVLSLAALGLLLAHAPDALANGTFPTLQAALRTLMNADASNNNYPANVRNRLLDCGAAAFTTGIPAGDQNAMLAVFNGAQLTPQSDAVFKQWFGYSPAAPQPTTNQAVVARLQHNAQQLCPDLAQQYPDFFKQ